jgi:hypothetical protein
MRDLARRAVACKGWRWMPGMVTEAGYVVLCDGGELTSEREFVANWYEHSEHFACIDEFDLPDLKNPATLGCLLALVREAWGQPDGVPVTVTHMGGYDSYELVVCGLGRWKDSPGQGSTEAEALVAALEAAP